MRRDISLLGANLVVAGLLAGALRGTTRDRGSSEKTERPEGLARGAEGRGEPEAPGRA
jgi:hypothetical protein